MNKESVEIWLVKFLIAAVVILNCVYISQGIILSADSIRYLYAAETFPHPRHLVGNEYFSVQPLLFPLFLKFFQLFTETQLGNVFIVLHIALYLVTLLFIFKTIDLFSTGRPLIGTFGKLFFACTYGFVYSYNYLLSETLFLPLVSAAVYFLAKYHLEKRDTNLYVYLLICALLPVTRYIGVFIFVFNLLYFIYLFRKKRLSILVFLTFVISAFPLAANLLVNYIESGNLTGGYRGRGKLSFSGNLFGLLEIMLEAFPIPLYDTIVFVGKRLLIGLAAIAVMITALYFILKKLNFRFHWKSHIFKFTALLFVITLLYILGMAYAATNTAFDNLDVRLIAPALIPAFLILILLLLQMDFKYISTVVVLLAICLAGFTGYRMSNAFSSKEEKAIALNSGFYYRKYYSHDEVFKKLKSETRKAGSRIYTNDPFRLMLYTGLTSEFLPERKYYNSPTPRYPAAEASEIVTGPNAILVIYEPTRYEAGRFYPLEIYTKSKVALFSSDSLMIFK